MRGLRRLALRKIGLFLGFLGALLAVGCSPRPQDPASETSPSPASNGSASAATCRRPIALAPSLVETLYVLGLGERVAGVGDFASWPPEVKTKPRLGGLVDPRLETIASLHADVAFLLPSERELGSKLDALGVAVQIVPNESLADVEGALRSIGAICGVSERGVALAEQLHRELVPRPLGRAKGARVLVVVGRPAGRLADIWVAGPGTFLDELLTRLGAENVFADATALYPQASLEEIVARRPDVILELRVDPASDAVAASLVADWNALPSIPAVVRGRVVVIARDDALIPGPRVAELYRALGAALDGAYAK